jgi:hypothetical protein
MPVVVANSIYTRALAVASSCTKQFRVLTMDLLCVRIYPRARPRGLSVFQS